MRNEVLLNSNLAITPFSWRSSFCWSTRLYNIVLDNPMCYCISTISTSAQKILLSLLDPAAGHRTTDVCVPCLFEVGVSQAEFSCPFHFFLEGKLGQSKAEAFFCSFWAPCLLARNCILQCWIASRRISESLSTAGCTARAIGAGRCWFRFLGRALVPTHQWMAQQLQCWHQPGPATRGGGREMDSAGLPSSLAPQFPSCQPLSCLCQWSCHCWRDWGDMACEMQQLCTHLLFTVILLVAVSFFQ